MALAELSMLEQRYHAVREVVDTAATVTDVAARHRVDRRTLHRWPVRYANDGIGALAEKSSNRSRHRAVTAPMIGCIHPEHLRGLGRYSVTVAHLR